MMEKIRLRPGHEISRIIKGHWQLAGGHGEIRTKEAIADMFSFVENGINAFDCADIYTGTEEMIGAFFREYENKYGSEARSDIKVHDKFVPDLAMLPKVSMEYVENVIDRSLKRLGVEAIDLVQFHWWDHEVPRYLEAAQYLRDLQRKGKIRHIGVTNFSPERLQEIVDSGVSVVSAQVQYSLLDRRPEKSLAAYCASKDIKLLCYGSLAGGFLSERYLGMPEPSEPLENRSLVKYKLIIDEFGDWKTFQGLLTVLSQIGAKHQVKISNVAMRYVLDKVSVASVIVGARNDSHLTGMLQTFDFSLDREDYAAIQAVLSEANPIPGEVYELERDKKGKHGRIMKYNLNQHDT